ncbi:MAG: hypothetical protein ACFFBE_06675 [Promethearchaeota archaeon]
MKITSIFNIILVVLLLILPQISLIGPAPQIEEQIYTGYNIFYSLIFFIPRIFTFGIIFIIIGLKYKEQIGPFLMYSGIFWTIFSTWAAICLYIPESFFPSLPQLLYTTGSIAEFEIYISIQNALGVGSIANILAYIFFMIHSYINHDRDLKIAGFIYIIGRSLMGLGLIPYYLSRL